MSGRNLYQVLQVDPSAEREVIEAAYRRLARKHHPDVSTASDAAHRMKELNAAYAVLGEPRRRAAYDRHLRQGGAAGSPETSPEPTGGPSCHLHSSAPPAGACQTCGIALCTACLDRFRPAMCAHCVRAWAGRRRMELLIPVVWFFVCIVFVAGLLASSLDGPDPPLDRRTTLAILALTYVFASFPCGWRVGSADGHPANAGAALLGAALLGPVIAPFRIAKILVWDLAHVGRLAALAVETERGHA